MQLHARRVEYITRFQVARNSSTATTSTTSAVRAFLEYWIRAEDSTSSTPTSTERSKWSPRWRVARPSWSRYGAHCRVGACGPSTTDARPCGFLASPRHATTPARNVGRQWPAETGGARPPVHRLAPPSLVIVTWAFRPNRGADRGPGRPVVSRRRLRFAPGCVRDRR
jgi:hypothetical protein